VRSTVALRAEAKQSEKKEQLLTMAPSGKECFHDLVLTAIKQIAYNTNTNIFYNKTLYKQLNHESKLISS